MIENLKRLWIDSSDTKRFVFVIVLMFTSPLWVIPFFFGMMLILTYTLIDMMVRGDE